jgi:corrinoid protein of di/trimethylamine methyltransferase
MSNAGLRATIHQAILDGDRQAIVPAVAKAVEEGDSPLALINDVLNPALKIVSNSFQRGDLYLPELMMVAEAMEAAMGVLNPLLEARKESVNTAGRVVMASVQGDIHDIGKNIVSALLRANGFVVLDLGRDVHASDIVKKAAEFNADIIGMSALLSTTLPYCRDTVRLLQEKGIRDKYHVFIGGGAATPEYAKEIGAEYGGAHAEAAVRAMLQAMGKG